MCTFKAMKQQNEYVNTELYKITANSQVGK